jgi:hypothetical protein
MLVEIGLGVAAVIGLVLIFVAARPRTFHIEPSAMVAAPVDAIFPLLE